MTKEGKKVKTRKGGVLLENKNVVNQVTKLSAYITAGESTGLYVRSSQQWWEATMKV